MLSMSALPTKHNTTGWILAGGRASRMGGVDKGMQIFRGQSLVQHAIERLRPQVTQVILNANRHVAEYALTGCQVVSDTVHTDHGPLSGFFNGLQHCNTEWLVTVPCDSPFFPLDLVDKLAAAAIQQQALIAMVQTQRTQETVWELQPVFCLMHRSLCASLHDFLQNDGRKISEWAHQQAALGLCTYSKPGSGPDPFANANTLQELQDLAS